MIFLNNSSTLDLISSIIKINNETKLPIIIKEEYYEDLINKINMITTDIPRIIIYKKLDQSLYKLFAQERIIVIVNDIVNKDNQNFLESSFIPIINLYFIFDNYTQSDLPDKYLYQDSIDSLNGLKMLINQYQQIHSSKVFIYNDKSYIFKGDYKNDKIPVSLMSIQSTKNNDEPINPLQRSIVSELQKSGKINLNLLSPKVPQEQKNIRIRLTCNWTDSKSLLKYWAHMLGEPQGENYKYDNIIFTADTDNIDYYVIINKPYQGDIYIAAKSLVFRMEPFIETIPFYNGWANPKDFLYFMEHKHYRNNSEWWLPKTTKELLTELPFLTNVEVLSIRDTCITPASPINKDFLDSKTQSIILNTLQRKSNDKKNTLSVIVSGLYNMPGHKLRIDFIKYLQANHPEINIDIYGKENPFSLNNYLGPLPVANKSNGLLPYRYHLSIENSDIKNYFTEKIIDPILAECLTFYWGCNNLDQHLPSDSYVRLPLNDFALAAKLLITSITNDLWSKKLPKIQQAKKLILESFALPSRVKSLIQIAEMTKYVLNMASRPDRWLSYNARAIAKDFSGFKKYPAIDGNKLEIDDFKELLRYYSMTNISKGVLGCGLSHIALWVETLIENKTALITEDDLVIGEHFIDYLSVVLSSAREVEWDIIYLTYFTNHEVCEVFNLNQEKIDAKNNDKVLIPFNDFAEYKVRYSENVYRHAYGYHGGSTAGYLLSPSGARKLLESINQSGLTIAVDYYMLHTSLTGKTKSFITWKKLAHAPLYLADTSDKEETLRKINKYEKNYLLSEDSDIQKQSKIGISTIVNKC